MSNQNIELNFLELTPHDFSYTIYRKRYVEADIHDNVYKYRLPKELNDKEYEDYCVTFAPTENFEQFECGSRTNIDLTLKFIHNQLVENSQGKDIEYSLGKKFYDRYIEFTIKTHPKGKEKISLSSYYLRQENKFGYLIDFSFRANHGEKLDKEILRLSLALGNDGRSNKNYYSDNYHKLQSFIQGQFKKINCFSANGVSFIISNNLFQTKSDFLAKKVFRFKNEQTDVNQFNGIRKFGAYKEIAENVKYVFVFEDRFRSFANNLYFSLIGKTNPGTFSGMLSFFNLPFNTQNVHKIQLSGYGRAEVLKAVNEVIEYRNANKDHKVIAIFLEPNRFDGLSPYESPYYIIKFHLTQENIPVQVVRDDQTNNANALKWSTSNIGLQIFSKLGGTPWKLKPSQNECLILGIGSAYERTEDDVIKKYYAYSVCLDSTGVYKKLDVLAEETTKDKYLESLGKNLVALFGTAEFSQYKKCALHISESVTKDAISTIQTALKNIADIEFVVLKVNLHNKFFGFSNHNTYVPYESSYIQLSSNEYLVWFDGLVQGKENIFQKIGNPIHIKFLNKESIEHKKQLEYLQDAINLSGANWRGFNAKQTPISIYYAKIVADYTSAFSHFEDFDQTHFSNNLPWFL